ncbi:histidine phosphatase family protein [Ruania alba]|uniref:Probable phosphoglycerate mutase n=1 Tax=Ruania alba TaxID=648782 RepID=A0A1H5HR12_9MICO|nr:histidine phosphatase family protein [Ruania alba]SEE30407.1 probable phosphoglycerate mutase [Ruania alba]
MTTIHLVRHGEAVWNAEGKYQGQADSGLTDLGHEQAHRAAAWLRASFPHVDGVAHSDLPRVRDTAAPFLTATGHNPLVDARLREIDVGSWAGRTFEEIASAEPASVAAAASGADVRRGGGETFAELRRRVVAALDEITASHPPGATLVVFTHGGPIRVATAAALSLPAPGHYPIGSPDNCSVTTLAWNPGRLLAFNQQTVGTRSAPSTTTDQETRCP